MIHLGIILGTIGALIAPMMSQMSKARMYVGGIGGFVWFAGVVYTFVTLGWKWGLASIVIGFFAYAIADKLYGARR